MDREGIADDARRADVDSRSACERSVELTVTIRVDGVRGMTYDDDGDVLWAAKDALDALDNADLAEMLCDAVAMATVADMTWEWD